LAPISRAANATACAWLPALAATTPRRSASSGSRAIALKAPRALKEPVSCRLSAFSSTRVPTRRESSPAGTSGVSRTRPEIRRAASSMLASVTLESTTAMQC